MKTINFDWVNAGQPFELPRVTVDVELEVLDYLAEHTTDKDSQKKQAYVEYAQTIAVLLRRIDKAVTTDMVLQHLTIEELTSLYLTARLGTRKTFRCPHCKETIGFYELLDNPADHPDFRQNPDDAGTSGTKPETSTASSSTSS